MKEKMATQHYRQGDVLFIRVDVIPADATPAATNIIVEGEATGHAHRLQDGMILMTAAVMYLACETMAHVVHEEHHAIDLPPGPYRVQRQREYSPEAIRMVVD
ncbi:MAG: hypothetical protein KGH75_00525 [Rhodospirillales bacterium]|nr:hypothetical protein [Rhodospirillales bacterium]